MKKKKIQQILGILHDETASPWQGTARLVPKVAAHRRELPVINFRLRTTLKLFLHEAHQHLLCLYLGELDAVVALSLQTQLRSTGSDISPRQWKPSVRQGLT